MNKLDKKATGTGDLGASLAGALRQALMQVEGMLPAVVIAVDRAAGRCTVKPMVMAGTVSGQKVARPQVAGVPIICLGAGGIYASYPVKAGDLGFLFAGDRDASLFYQSSGGEDWPNTERLHSFSDAMWFPDTIKDWAIDGANADAVVWQSMDGSVCIALHADKITITAPKLVVDVPETEWTGNIKQTGDTERTGELTQTGGITASGGGTYAGGADFTGGAVTHNGTDIGDTHTHSDVESGDDTSGPPV